MTSRPNLSCMATIARGGHLVPRLDGWGTHWTIMALLCRLNPSLDIHFRPGALPALTFGAAPRILYLKTLRRYMKQYSAKTTRRLQWLSKQPICITIE